MTDFEPKLALFLGAGFSKAWGLPLASEVIDAVSTTDFPAKWQVELIGRVEKAWQKAKSEGCVSVDEFGRLIQVKRWTNLFGLSHKDFTSFLALRLSSVHWKVGGARETKWGTGDHVRMKRIIDSPYREFLAGIARSHLVGIVTTNYDLIIEKMLGPSCRGRMGGFNYGDANEPLIGRHHVSSRWSYGPGVKITGRVPLLKLHGSLNWGVSPDLELIKYIDARPSRGLRYEALIVPPGKSKRHALLDPVWHRAARVLKEANIWIFCGYSLPDYDGDVRKLIKSNAKERQKIIVMDKDAVAVSQKLRGFLTLPKIIHGPQVDSDLKSRAITSAISVISGAKVTAGIGTRTNRQRH
jgi:hypothetical protein